MDRQQTEQPRRRRRRAVRIVSSVLGLLVLLGSAGVALLPFAIDRVVTHWLVRQGVDQARIENVDFNPFTGTLFVRGLRAVADGTSVLAASEFGFTFEWGPLLDGELKVDRIHLRGLELVISQAEHGVTVAGILLGGPAAGTGTVPAGWRFKVDDWVVSDSVVTFRAHGVDTVFRADAWQIDDLSSTPGGKPTRVRFEGSVNHAPLSFDATLTPFTEAPGWRGHVTLEALELAPLRSGFDAPVAGLAGRVSADGETAVELAGDGTLKVDYTGDLGLQAMDIRTDGDDQLALDGFRWTGRLGLKAGDATVVEGDGEVRLDRFDLALPGDDVTTRAETVGGPVTFQLQRPTAAGPGIGLSASGSLEGERVEVSFPEAGVTVTNATPSWSGALTLEGPEAAEAPLQLDVTGDIAADRVAVDLAREDVHVAHTGMAWTGQVGLTGEPQEVRLALAGALAGEEVTVDLPGEGVHVRHQGLAWDGNLDLGVPEGEAPVRLAVEGDLTGQDLTLKMPDQGLELGHRDLGWSGRFALSGPAADDLLSAQGRLSSARVALSLTGPSLESAYESVEWEGRFRLADTPDGPAPVLRGAVTGGPWRLDLTGPAVRVAGDALRWREPVPETPADQAALLRGDLGADALAVTRIGAGTRLFTSDRVDFKDLRAGPGLQAEAVGLGRLTALPGPEGVDGDDLITAASARLEAPRLGDDGTLSAALLEVRDLTTELTRSADGALRLGPSGDGNGGPDAAGADGSGAIGLPVRVKRIHLAGNNRLHFRDRSVEPAFETTLRLTRVEMDDLDLSRPEAGARLVLEGGIGDYTTLAVNGTVAPLAEPIRLDLKGRVNDLDLPPLSPYAVRALGYHITRGHMDTESELAIEDGKLDGKNKLTFRNLGVEPAANSKTEELTAQIKMPLGQALKMLRDKEDNIQMTMPVSGDITAPEFDFGDAVQQALGSTVRFAAINYLKYALGPYGTLISMVQWAGKAADYAGAIRLDPIAFEPGSAILDDKARDYIDHIATLMGERPELRVNLCGWAAPADRGALAPQTAEGRTRRRPPAVDDAVLLDLARDRAERVKERLTAGHGVAPERLFLCRPELDPDTEARPRVEPLI